VTDAAAVSSSIPKETNVKFQCLLGPTDQRIANNVYSFQKDAEGRFVAEVFDDQHIKCFAEHSAYAEVKDDDRASAPPPAQAPEVQTELPKAKLIEHAHSLGLSVTQRMSVDKITALIAEEEERLALVESVAAEHAAAAAKAKQEAAKAPLPAAEAEGEGGEHGDSAAAGLDAADDADTGTDSDE
jgi:hypothetical protein